MHAGVADRPPDGRGVAVGRAAAEGVDGILGRPVQIVTICVLSVAQARPDRVGDRLAAEQHQHRPVPPGRGLPLRVRRPIPIIGAVQQPVLEQQPGVGRRHVDHIDAVRVAIGHQGLGVAAQLLVADVHLMPFDEPEQLLPGHVEREGHGVRDPQPPPAGGGDRRPENGLPVVELHVRQPPVRGDDALGTAGGPGGVDDVGGMVQPARPAGGEPGPLVVGQAVTGQRGEPFGHRRVVEQDAGGRRAHPAAPTPSRVRPACVRPVRVRAGPVRACSVRVRRGRAGGDRQ